MIRVGSAAEPPMAPIRRFASSALLRTAPPSMVRTSAAVLRHPSIAHAQLAFTRLCSIRAHAGGNRSVGSLPNVVRRLGCHQPFSSTLHRLGRGMATTGKQALSAGRAICPRLDRRRRRGVEHPATLDLGQTRFSFRMGGQSRHRPQTNRFPRLPMDRISRHPNRPILCDRLSLLGNDGPFGIRRMAPATPKPPRQHMRQMRI